ncbi:uncharacterized protein CIMG_13606 [Coccidioides immitis RS]|uniref:Uncharacterized protein n=1 Tax=Coccidioides immitis (strain RS) TaxID=246410 RepID=A0A0D8JWQ7_COCIM|nr:uncharacterized protein CIMG_13606 [Coccidioides immitis RS]KJF61366.1 hypothetical protein CIMG_13606 [Coccidioides immitis RS]
MGSPLDQLSGDISKLSVFLDLRRPDFKKGSQSGYLQNILDSCAEEDLSRTEVTAQVASSLFSILQYTISHFFEAGQSQNLNGLGFESGGGVKMPFQSAFGDYIEVELKGSDTFLPRQSTLRLPSFASTRFNLRG